MDIRHVGSTAIRGIVAKPIWDIAMVVLLRPSAPRLDIPESLTYTEPDLAARAALRSAFALPQGADC